MFSKALIWFKALRDTVEVEFEWEVLSPTNPPNANTPLSVALVAHGSEHCTLSQVAHNGDPTITVHVHNVLVLDVMSLVWLF